MARKPKVYQKLARMRGGVGNHFTLWLAADHVLQIEANLLTERYQRVFLRDLQGFFIRPSREAKWVTYGALVVMTLFSIFGATADGGAAIAFWVFAGLSAVVLLYGLFFARNCHFYAVTAVQRAEWVNVARRGRAKKVIARLDPLIRAAQQDVSVNV